jgi:hypothetical protein
MTPQENIRAAQKAYDDFKRGDIAAVLEAVDDSIQWTNPGDSSIATAGTRRGKAEVAEFFKIVADTWIFNTFEPREFVAQGDRVVAIGHYDATGRHTGGKVSADWVMVWRFRNGKAIEFQEYTDTLMLSRALATA